jgi:hypothetical protein
MAHPLKHAESSARKFGGKANDYLPIHNWFDESKAFLADFRHRALRHHAEGIFLAERLFGRHSTSARLAKRKSAPASSSLPNCGTGLPRKAHRGSRPSSKRCLGRLKSCPSRCLRMPPTDYCERDLSRLAGQSAPTTCLLWLRHFHLVIRSSQITKESSATSKIFDKKTGCAKLNGAGAP